MFGKLTKIMLCISSLSCLICMGVCIYIATVEPAWYVGAMLFLLAAFWFGYSAYRSFKDEKKNCDPQP